MMANRVPTPKRYESVFLRKHFPELSNMQIAQRLNISEKSVRRYNKQYTIKGHLRDDYSKCGRHKKLNSRGERGLTREFLQDPRLPLTTCVSNYNARLEINDQISYMTAWRSLQRNDIVCRVLRKKPLLNPSHLRARKAFYSANKNKTKSDWKQYAFSDETQILAHPKSGRLYFRKRLEADPSKT